MFHEEDSLYDLSETSALIAADHLFIAIMSDIECDFDVVRLITMRLDENNTCQLVFWILTDHGTIEKYDLHKVEHVKTNSLFMNKYMCVMCVGV